VLSVFQGIATRRNVRSDIASAKGRSVDSGNVAEGYGRDSKGSYVSFLKIAQGSLKELETHLILAQRLKLGNFDLATDLISRCEALGRMLRGLIRNVQIASEY
jgi:four helix bundle protein